MKQEKETTSITLPTPLKRRLEQEAQLPQYQGIHGKPNQSKVVQAALDKFLNNGAASSSKQSESNHVPSWKREAMQILEPEREIEVDVKEDIRVLNEKVDRLANALKIVIEESMRGN